MDSNTHHADIAEAATYKSGDLIIEAEKTNAYNSEIVPDAERIAAATLALAAATHAQAESIRYLAGILHEGSKIGGFLERMGALTDTFNRQQ
tara:strand:+ start:56 stop:331 length:276 start_codon:yes stop_codon:yes gene_type:complete